MDKNLISVIIPIYKVEKFLDRCVNSVVNQSYKNLEIILVDDGSPDNCPTMCDSWKEKDNRIVVIHKPNGGLSSARNAGLNVATGDYIAYVDSDDFLDLRAYEKMISNLKQEESDIVFCRVYRATDNGDKQKYIERNFNCFAQKNILPMFYIDGTGLDSTNNLCTVWRSVYKASLIKNIRFREEVNLAEDLPYMVEVILKAKKISVIDDYLYYYYQNDNSICNTLNNELLLNRLTIFYNNVKSVLEENNALNALPYLKYRFLLKYIMNLVTKKDFKKIIKKDLVESKELASCINKQDYLVIKNLPTKKISKIRNYLIYHKRWTLLRLLYTIKK